MIFTVLWGLSRCNYGTNCYTLASSGQNCQVCDDFTVLYELTPPLGQNCLSCLSAASRSPQLECSKCSDPQTYLQYYFCAGCCYQNQPLSASLLVVSCQAGFYRQLTYCSLCYEYCSTCISTTSCLSCGAAYLLQGTTCVRHCSISYFASQQTCLPCVSACLFCTSSTNSCKECSFGYMLSKLGNCVFCDFYFHLDDSGAIKCLKACPTGYYSQNTTGVLRCYRCFLANCGTCTAAACSMCAPGYFLSRGQCTSCGQHCQTCASATACATCVNGAYLNNTQKTCSLDCGAGNYGDNSLSTCFSCGKNCPPFKYDIKATNMMRMGQLIYVSVQFTEDILSTLLETRLNVAIGLQLVEGQSFLNLKAREFSLQGTTLALTYNFTSLSKYRGKTVNAYCFINDSRAFPNSPSLLHYDYLTDSIPEDLEREDQLSFIFRSVCVATSLAGMLLGLAHFYLLRESNWFCQSLQMVFFPVIDSTFTSNYANEYAVGTLLPLFQYFSIDFGLSPRSNSHFLQRNNYLLLDGLPLLLVFGFSFACYVATLLISRQKEFRKKVYGLLAASISCDLHIVTPSLSYLLSAGFGYLFMLARNGVLITAVTNLGLLTQKRLSAVQYAEATACLLTLAVNLVLVVWGQYYLYRQQGSFAILFYFATVIGYALAERHLTVFSEHIDYCLAFMLLLFVYNIVNSYQQPRLALLEIVAGAGFAVCVGLVELPSGEIEVQLAVLLMLSLLCKGGGLFLKMQSRIKKKSQFIEELNLSEQNFMPTERKKEEAAELAFNFPVEITMQ